MDARWVNGGRNEGGSERGRQRDDTWMSSESNVATTGR